MANEAYIYRLRTDLGSGAMQITDLKPNTSRRAFSYESYGQSGYMPAAAPGVSATNPTDDGGGADGGMLAQRIKFGGNLRCQLTSGDKDQGLL